MRPLPTCPFHQTPREKGSVLITGLIFLVILTMIVLSLLSTGTLEERMAANARNRQVALQAAEALIRDAETTLFVAAPFDPFDAAQFTNDCANGICGPVPINTDPRWRTINWDANNLTMSFAGTNPDRELSGVPGQPRYIVELVTAPAPINSNHRNCSAGVVNITARGIGNNNATVFIQTSYRFQPSAC